MEITLTTPALLFSTLSLLILAYTNRFSAIARLIRELHSRYKSQPDQSIIAQLKYLKRRMILIRNTQIFGVTSLFLCVLCMLLLFAGRTLLGEYVFGLSLLMMMISLSHSLSEMLVSVRALNMQLSDLEDLEEHAA